MAVFHVGCRDDATICKQSSLALHVSLCGICKGWVSRQDPNLEGRCDREYVRSLGSIIVQGFSMPQGLARGRGVGPPCSLPPTLTNRPTATRRNDDETDPKISGCHIRWFASHSSPRRGTSISSRCHQPLAAAPSFPFARGGQPEGASPEIAATRPAHPLPDWACF